MKKRFSILIAGLLLILAPLALAAQEKPKDTFVGIWDITIEGTPNGDFTMRVKFERIDGELKGSLVKQENSENTESAEGFGMEFSKIEEKEGKSFIAHFASDSGYDVYLSLEKKDDNSLVGSMMDMFDAYGKRVVE